MSQLTTLSVFSIIDHIPGSRRLAVAGPIAPLASVITLLQVTYELTITGIKGITVRRLQAAAKLILNRRVLLQAAAAGISGLAAPALVGRASGQAVNWSSGDPFSLGVASGAPSTQGFVIWSRLAPFPLSPDPASVGGMWPEPVSIIYEIATDDTMRDVVQLGTVLAEPAYTHAVHVDVTGLKPGRSYWYRFSSGKSDIAPCPKSARS
jgi:hypothetical protein